MKYPTLSDAYVREHNREKTIGGYLGDKKYIDYVHHEQISGKIGSWSKADSYVLFDNFIVQPILRK